MKADDGDLNSQVDKTRKNNKSPPVVGTKEGVGLTGVAPRVKHFWDLFVSNLAENTTDFQLKSYLQDHHIEVKDVFLLKSKKRGTKSAKVRIAIEHKNKAKNGDIWPKYIRVQDTTLYLHLVV